MYTSEFTRTFERLRAPPAVCYDTSDRYYKKATTNRRAADLSPVSSQVLDRDDAGYRNGLTSAPEPHGMMGVATIHT
jgi:hypothetical protein